MDGLGLDVRGARFKGEHVGAARVGGAVAAKVWCYPAGAAL